MNSLDCKIESKSLCDTVESCIVLFVTTGITGKCTNLGDWNTISETQSTIYHLMAERNPDVS